MSLTEIIARLDDLANWTGTKTEAMQEAKALRDLLAKQTGVK